MGCGKSELMDGDCRLTSDVPPELFARWCTGRRALNELLPLIYPQLRRVVRKPPSGQRAGDTLQTTPLIHEAYCLRLAGVIDGVAPQTEPDVIAIDEALTRLAELDVQQAHAVEFRYFGGLSVRDTTHALRISAAAVERDGTTARTWQRSELHASRP